MAQQELIICNNDNKVIESEDEAEICKLHELEFCSDECLQNHITKEHKTNGESNGKINGETNGKNGAPLSTEKLEQLKKSGVKPKKATLHISEIIGGKQWRESIDNDRAMSLAMDMFLNGQTHRIEVEEREDGYFLLDGWHRTEGLRKTGYLETLDAWVWPFVSEFETLFRAYKFNLMQLKYTDMEMATALKTLYQLKKKKNPDMTQQQFYDQHIKDELDHVHSLQNMKDLIQVAGLSQAILDMIDRDELARTTAQLLTKIEDATRRTWLARYVAENSISRNNVRNGDYLDIVNKATDEEFERLQLGTSFDDVRKLVHDREPVLWFRSEYPDDLNTLPERFKLREFKELHEQDSTKARKFLAFHRNIERWSKFAEVLEKQLPRIKKADKTNDFDIDILRKLRPWYLMADTAKDLLQEYLIDLPNLWYAAFKRVEMLNFDILPEIQKLCDRGFIYSAVVVANVYKQRQLKKVKLTIAKQGLVERLEELQAHENLSNDVPDQEEVEKLLSDLENLDIDGIEDLETIEGRIEELEDIYSSFDEEEEYGMFDVKEYMIDSLHMSVEKLNEKYKAMNVTSRPSVTTLQLKRIKDNLVSKTNPEKITKGIQGWEYTCLNCEVRTKFRSTIPRDLKSLNCVICVNCRDKLEDGILEFSSSLKLLLNEIDKTKDVLVKKENVIESQKSFEEVVEESVQCKKNPEMRHLIDEECTCEKSDQSIKKDLEEYQDWTCSRCGQSNNNKTGICTVCSYSKVEEDQTFEYETDHRVINRSSRNMEELESGSIDLIVTSPPYNTEKDYGSNPENAENMSWDEFISHMQDTVNESYRVLAAGGRMVINVANLKRPSKSDSTSRYLPLDHLFAEMAREAGFLMMGTHIWYKTESANVTSAWGSYRLPTLPAIRDTHEYILVFSKPDDQGNLTTLERPDELQDYQIPKDQFLEWTKSVWTIPPAKNSDHPCVYPPELVRRIVGLYSFPNNMVLDPFAGSGTTAAVAKELQRNSVSYEIETKFISVIEGRLNSDIKQWFKELPGGDQ